MLDDFCDILKPGEVPMMKRGHFGVYNPLANRSRMNSVQKHQEDLILLLEVLPEFSFVAKGKINLFATDELTRGLMNMVKSKEIPVWLTFATTIFLDIHHILRDRVEDILTKLETIGMCSSTFADLELYLIFVIS